MRLDLESPRARRRLISLTPLIDVVFILLIFFMLASNLVDWRLLEMDAPGATGNGDAMTGAWLVRVRADTLDLNAQTIDTATLLQRVASQVDAEPEQRVLIQTGPDVSLQRLIDIIDLLRQAGASQLTLLAP
jgi:biopolymer transport protein ExbD